MKALADALRFVKIAQLDAGAPQYRHCVLFDHWAYGTDGVLTAGHPIAEDLALAPLTGRLIQALERCDEHLAMTALPSGLSVKSGRFRAVVPCHDLGAMPDMRADPPIAPIDDRLRAAFAAVGPLVSGTAQRVVLAAVRLSAGTATGSNGHALIEYWHGIDLPTVLLPKAAVTAIEAVKVPLAQFGFSKGSATFHFADRSWLKTQLYEDGYPAFDQILSKPSDQWPVPAGFFDALKTLEPFVDSAYRVGFAQNLLYTNASKDSEGASIEVDGLPGDRCFNLHYLRMIETLAKTVDFGKDRAPLLFFGDNVRGAIAPMSGFGG